MIHHYTQIAAQHPRAGKIKLVAPAVTYNGKRMPVTRPPPYLSQHTSEVSADGVAPSGSNSGLQVLQELGYSIERIAELRSRSVI